MKMSPYENTKQFPALAPGPPRMFAPQTSTAVSRPKKNSTACLACKHAKRKCSGPEAPCKACRSTGTQCFFDPSRDLRRKVAVKRTIKELTNHKDLLASLLSTLASDDQPQFDKVVDLIRKKAPFQDIAHAVGCPVTTFGNLQELFEANKKAGLDFGDPIETSDNGLRRPSDPGDIASSPDEISNMKPPQWPTGSSYSPVTPDEIPNMKPPQWPTGSSYSPVTPDEIPNMKPPQWPAASPYAPVTPDEIPNMKPPQWPTASPYAPVTPDEIPNMKPPQWPAASPYAPVTPDEIPNMKPPQWPAASSYAPVTPDEIPNMKPPQWPTASSYAPVTPDEIPNMKPPQWPTASSYAPVTPDEIPNMKPPQWPTASSYAPVTPDEIPNMKPPQWPTASPYAPVTPDEIPNMKPPQWPTVSPYARVTLESLCDIPLFEVPAKPWTKVTDDNYLVSHLVSLYFTWDHPCSQFLDQRIFLEHMKLGDRRSEFCTPLLVNSILSMASAYSDSPDVLSTPENVFSRGQNFFHEAQRLWEAEDDGHDLTNIQALLMMCCVFKCQGRVQKGWMMLCQAVQIARDIGLFDIPAVSKKLLSEMEQVRTITAWGVFSMSSQTSIELQKIAPSAYPTSNVKLCGNEDLDWTPYPRSNNITYDKKPARLPQVRDGLAEVNIILVDVQKLVSDKCRGASFKELWNKAQEPFDRLNSWLQRWPSVPEIQRNSVPQVLLLRIKCLQAIIYLFEMLKDPHQPGSVRDARYYQVKSAEETAQCLRIHRQSYGLKHIPSQVVDAVQTGLRILVRELEESDESRQAFSELCRFGTALSYRFKQTADVLHEIRKNALHLSIRLPPEAIAIFDDPEQWRSLEP